MTLSRRFLLRSTGLCAAGTCALPGFVSRALAQAPARAGARKVLVTVFLRGGADGLSLVPPFADPGYPALRPHLGLLRPGAGDGAALDLDGHYGLHPSLAPLSDLWRRGLLAVVHGVGLHGATRSHFDAQDFLDTGTPGRKGTPDGWLNRAVASAGPAPGTAAFRAVAVQGALPLSLAGASPALAVDALSSFRIRAGRMSARAVPTFEALYEGAVDEAVRAAGLETFDALAQVDRAKLSLAPAHNGAEYPRSPLGRRLQDLARLIHAGVGLQVGVTECGGWDTHVAQGREKGALANRLLDLGRALSAFVQDLGEAKMADVCLLTVTEFGRTARENGNRGTDHGTASALFVVGGGVRAQKVHGGLPELKEAHLFEGRDVPIRVDIRQVLGEAVQAQLGPVPLDAVFPGFTRGPGLGLFG